MILCFFGVSMIAFCKDDSREYSATAQYLGVMISLTAAFLVSVSNVATRRLRDVNANVICFYHSILGIVVFSLWLVGHYIISGEGMTRHSTQVYVMVLVSAIFDYLAFMFRTQAYQIESSGFVALVGNVGVVYGFMADVIVLGKEIKWMAISGALLILVTQIGLAVHKFRTE